MLKGNDYLLIWLLTEPDGTPIDYNQFESYKVFIQNDSNKSYKYEVVTAALDDGLHFDFKSDMQKSTGYYSLIFEAVKDGRNYKAECYRGVHIDGNVDKAQCVVGAPNSIIKLTDCLSLYLGGRDGRSPYVGVNNHWWVFDDVHKAYVDTGIKVDYSSEIGAQITLAEQAIERVNQTNQAVSENEISRSQNEAVRVQEERTRMANEAKRVDDEKVRVANEAKRAEDEAERLSNEASRKNSEAARVNNETARVSGEDVRVRNEASRASGESTRVSNENTRKSNEADRVNSESARVLAEQSRVAEEIIRVANETKRQTDTAKAIQDTNTAAQNATDVAAGMEQQIVQLQQGLNGKLDKPTNAGEENMVLTKTATGSEWQPSKGGGWINQLATDLFNDSTANGAYITEIMNSAMIGSNSTPTEVYCLKRPSTSYGGLFSDWFKSVKKINSIYIDRSDVYFTHWLVNFTGDTIGYLSIKDGVYVGEALLAWCANLCNIKIKPGCIVVKTGVSLDLSLIGNNAPSLSRDFIENIINGLGVVGNANVRLSSKIKNNMTQSDIELVTSKGWTLL